MKSDIIDLNMSIYPFWIDICRYRDIDFLCNQDIIRYSFCVNMKYKKSNIWLLTVSGDIFNNTILYNLCEDKKRIIKSIKKYHHLPNIIDNTLSIEQLRYSINNTRYISIYFDFNIIYILYNKGVSAI